MDGTRRWSGRDVGVGFDEVDLKWMSEVLRSQLGYATYCGKIVLHHRRSSVVPPIVCYPDILYDTVSGKEWML